MKEIFNNASQEYNNYMSNIVPEFWTYLGYLHRRKQIESVINIINDKFNFEKLIVLETGSSYSHNDGVFGLFLGMAASKTNGKMISVDINKKNTEDSLDLFNKVIPNLNYNVYTNDSIQFLSTLDEIPNIVHLDSFDLNLKNPYPAALHGWREFTAIESKMMSGSIIIIDDNYTQNTWVDWVYSDGRPTERIVNNYPMIGKGSLVYHHVLDNSNWKLIGNHYNSHENIKIIIQKD